MARIPKDELERLKRETDLAALVRAHGVELRKHGGSDLIGRCVFHDDTRAEPGGDARGRTSSTVSGCGAAGSVVDWVMKTEGVSFRHAVELLREGSSSLAASDPPRKRTTVRRLPCPLELDAADAELLGQVVGYYHETLEGDAGGLAYLERRGLAHPDLVDHFSLGLANRTLGLRLPKKSRKAGAELRSRLQNARRHPLLGPRASERLPDHPRPRRGGPGRRDLRPAGQRPRRTAQATSTCRVRTAASSTSTPSGSRKKSSSARRSSTP